MDRLLLPKQLPRYASVLHAGGERWERRGPLSNSGNELIYLLLMKISAFSFARQKIWLSSSRDQPHCPEKNDLPLPSCDVRISSKAAMAGKFTDQISACNGQCTIDCKMTVCSCLYRGHFNLLKFCGEASGPHMNITENKVKSQHITEV